MRLNRLVPVAAAVLALSALPVFAAPAFALAPLVVTVNPAGTANPDGSATVSGTVTCPLGNTFYGTAQVWQPTRSTPNATAGQGTFGSVFAQVPCTGSPQPWSVTTTARTRAFLAGPADVRAIFSTQGPAGLNTVATDSLVVLA